MKLEEKTIKTNRIFEGRIVNLRVDTVELPDGRRTTREVVEHKGAVAVVPLLMMPAMPPGILPGGMKVVMVKQYRQPTGQILIEIPAGTLDTQEDAVECANRELAEETGYAAGKMTRMFSTYLSPGYSNEMLHTFLAEDLTPAKADHDEDEFLEVVTFDLDEAVNMIGSGQIKDAKTVCGLLMAQRLKQ